MADDTLFEKLKSWYDDTARDTYHAMISTMFPVNKTSQSYSQEAFYNWRIFGSPYMLIDDPPLGQLNNSWFLGEWYANQLRESQILTIKVGSPKYTANVKGVTLIDWLGGIVQQEEEGKSWLDSVTDTFGAMAFSSINSLDDARRQYTFYNQYESYIQHVRLLIISMASYLGIMDYPLPVLNNDKSSFKYEKIRSVDWTTYTTGGAKPPTIQSIFGNTFDAVGDNINEKYTSDGKSIYDIAGGPPAIIQFIIQPAYSTDSFSNTTTESMASQVSRKNSGMGQEVAWMTGSSVNDTLVESIVELMGEGAKAFGTAMEQSSTSASISIMGSAVIGAIRGLTGERMIFPKIYSQSSYSKEMQYGIHLASPAGDNYSYFINIGLPLCYLIPMIAPRMSSTNAYKTPFMVQSYVTGQTAIPLGIVGGMTITRGANGGMNKDGLPLEVDVILRIEDLYDVIAVSPLNDPAQFLSNDTLMNYIASYSPIDTWNQSILNSYIFNEISNEVEDAGWSIDSVWNQIKYNISEYAGNQLKMYNIAASIR